MSGFEASLSLYRLGEGYKGQNELRSSLQHCGGRALGFTGVVHLHLIVEARVLHV